MKALAVLVLLAACGDPAHPRRYPRWVTASTESVEWRGCAGLRAFVRKSGKQGIGVALELRSKLDCALEVNAQVVLEDGTTSAVTGSWTMRGRSLRYEWLAFRFDGDRAWNRGARTGRIDLAIVAGGEAQPALSIPLSTIWKGTWGDEP